MATLSAQAIRVHDIEAVICSEPMRKLMAMAERVARGNAAILITGETGSGKELIARAIHQHSLRSGKPWVDLNCAALPEHLVESELFGYEKGAFSGADSVKQGLFELADKGTLFLDEIGELDPKIQVKLLRVLDGVPFYRLGGSRKVAVDVRIVAATNQPLDEAVRHGKFRSDLYHRLGQIQLRVPPLRERIEDIAPLAHAFLKQTHPGLELSYDAIELLHSYSWPGNIRELRNVVLQAATIAEDGIVQPSHLPVEITGSRNEAVGKSDSDAPASLDEIERQTILQALQRVGGHQGMAADQLGISRRTLIRKLKQYKIDDQEASRGPLGKLGRAEQQYFRATVDVPVLLVTENAQQTVKAVNVSLGGIAVTGITDPFQFAKGMALRFDLPGLGPRIEAVGQIVWADVQGQAGIRFAEILPDLQAQLKRWLLQKQWEEGWSVSETA